MLLPCKNVHLQELWCVCNCFEHCSYMYTQVRVLIDFSEEHTCIYSSHTTCTNVPVQVAPECNHLVQKVFMHVCFHKHFLHQGL